LRFRVKDWMAYGMGLQGKQAWQAWACDMPPTAAEPISEPELPVLLRRRVTQAGKLAFRAACGIGMESDLRFIFCSRHGEFERTLRLLEAIAAREPVSPADFSLSVHNALAGLLSIAWQNQEGHTTIAAGHDSFGYGMLEAAASLATSPAQPILLIYSTAPLPGVYAELGEPAGPELGLALVLTAAHGNESDLSVVCEPLSKPSLPPPSDQALEFLRFFLTHEHEASALGGRMRWWWRHAK